MAIHGMGWEAQLFLLGTVAALGIDYLLRGCKLCVRIKMARRGDVGRCRKCAFI